MAQQTAMQHILSLVEQMYNNAKTIEVESVINDVINIITQDGMPMEKEQQFRFFIAGQLSMEEGGKDFEQYYNETYDRTADTK